MTTIRVPDIGDASNVTVIEVAVAQGDTVAEGDTLIVLESDKASMEIPADASGVVGAIHVSEGSEVNEGDAICELDSADAVGSAPIEPPPAEALTAAPVATAPVSQEATVSEQVVVPDTGSADGVTVIEVAVSVGDTVAEGDTLIVLESDKASMEIPAPRAGVISALIVTEGQQVVQGDPICEMSVTDGSPAVAPSQAPVADTPTTPVPAAASNRAGGLEKVVVPDTGNADGVTVIEVSVAIGDTVAEGDTLIVLESDKASMEIPSPVSGKIVALAVKEGDSVAQGDAIADVESTSGSATSASPAAQPSEPVAPVAPAAAQSKKIEP
ncbi:MAG TPA: pyruvate dehydrogenase complex dihydrolipoyllysine-residue acetyltransferase, partial [Gammaproteobacteria bacterium]|nr:pyruvate dehydrogenase complex dihydrolipoyllysine-residue acetyltransferase [Gammaproteobacteria bacterium]